MAVEEVQGLFRKITSPVSKLGTRIFLKNASQVGNTLHRDDRRKAGKALQRVRPETEPLVHWPQVLAAASFFIPNGSVFSLPAPPRRYTTNQSHRAVYWLPVWILSIYCLSKPSSEETLAHFLKTQVCHFFSSCPCVSLA